MSAEAGYESGQEGAPIRISGFISAIFGVMSAITFLGWPLLVIPIIGILLGMFALRRHGDLVPVGITAARIGLLLSIGFGAFGLGVPVLKWNTLGVQGEFFARQYIELVAQGEDYYCMELQKEYRNRYLKNMSLEELYTEDNENAMQSLEEYRGNGAVETVKRLGPGANWELDRAISVYHKYGQEHVDLVFVNDPRAKKPIKIRIILQCILRESTGDFEWHVDRFMVDRKRLVAESIL